MTHDALAKLRRRKPPEGWVTAERSCDGCNVCCVAMPIKEMDKPPGVACDKLCDAGCSIYDQRPKVCREFYCLWRMSTKLLPEWLDPKTCGFALTFNDTERWPGVITVHPMPGVDPLANPWSRTVFGAIARHWNCMVAVGSAPWTTHVITPTNQLVTPETFPDMVSMGSVGVPDFMFGPIKRPLVEMIRDVRLDWKLPPPPGPLQDIRTPA